MPEKSQNQFNQEFLQSHLKLMQSLTIFAGILFLAWAVLISAIEDMQYEIWPIRVSITALFIILGYSSKRFRLSLHATEWGFSCVASLAVSYALFVAWRMGFHPTWISGTTLIIVGALNFLTYRGPSIYFTTASILMSLSTFAYNDPVHIMDSQSVFTNFMTAIALGGLSSFQRNKFLNQLLQLGSQQSHILNSLSEGIILQDKNGKVLLSNHAASRYLGMGEKGLADKTDILQEIKATHPDGATIGDKNSPRKQALESGLPILDARMHIENKDGRKLWIDTSVVPIHLFSNDEAFDATVSSLKDVTKLKEALDTVDQQKESLFANSKLSALGEMSAGIAHEINNPLAVIMGSAQQLKRSIPKNIENYPDVDKKIDLVLKTTERISRIISSMRALSRQTEQDQADSISLSQIFDEVRELCEEGIRHHDVELKFSVEPQLTIHGHHGQIGQAILNLINNAKDAVAGAEQKWILVEARTNEHHQAEINVIDSGPGIPKELRQKIMQPFFTTKDIGKGTGLGLSLVRSIVMNHHGQFSLIQDSPHTCFRITLPQSR